MQQVREQGSGGDRARRQGGAGGARRRGRAPAAAELGMRGSAGGGYARRQGGAGRGGRDLVSEGGAECGEVLGRSQAPQGRKGLAPPGGTAAWEAELGLLREERGGDVLVTDMCGPHNGG